MIASMFNRQMWLPTFLTAMTVATLGCAALQPPSASGPRGNEPAYPILFSEDAQRRAASVAAGNLLMQPGASDVTVQLQPITSTVSAVAADPGRPLYLPKLGTGAAMNEEETRESLRRFIKDWQALIGADAAKLSLIDRLDQPDGTRLATYEHRPFRYPIRGNYGKLHIRFTTDRRLLDISSTCIPDADRIHTALAPIVLKLRAEDVVTKLQDTPIAFKDPSGTSSFRASPAQMTARELVTYILPSAGRTDALEFHIAWEINLANAPVKTVYVDAVNGEIIAVE
jgi:hypothetical protein